MAERGRNDYYEDALGLLVDRGEAHITPLPVGDRRWYEIDDEQDLEKASMLFAGYAPTPTPRVQGDAPTG